MSVELVHEYMLLIDERPTSVHQTFELAAQAALAHHNSDAKLKIRTTSSAVHTSNGLVVVPLREWNYATDIRQWVERLR